MKIVIKDRESILQQAAGIISDTAVRKPDCAIAFAAGETAKRIYAKLAADEKTDFSGCKAFNVTEYVGLCSDDKNSCAAELNEELYSKLGISEIHVPGADNFETFDEEIAAAGGLELAVLGIGTNGHIGFNEPATLFDTYTHVAKLTDKTKAMKAEKFGGADNVPDEAYTMGLKTLCSARNVLLCALGEEKADIVYNLVYGKTSTYVPAAMLQMHMNMTLLLDDAAGAKLK